MARKERRNVIDGDGMLDISKCKEVLTCLILLVILVSSVSSCCIGRSDTKTILTQLVQLKMIAQPVQCCPIGSEPVVNENLDGENNGGGNVH